MSSTSAQVGTVISSAMLGGLLCGGERVLVAAEPVVEQRARPVASTVTSDSLATGDRVGQGALDEGARLGLAALPGEQPERAERRQAAARRLADRRRLLDERRGGSQVAGEEVHVDPRVERERQLAEGPACASQFCTWRADSASQPSSSRRSEAAMQASHSQEGPPVPAGRCRSRNASSACRSGRRRGRVAVGEPDREGVQEQVGRRVAAARRGSRARGLGDVSHADAARQPAGEHRCGERLEVGVARERDVERARGAARRAEGAVRRRCRGSTANAIWARSRSACPRPSSSSGPASRRGEQRERPCRTLRPRHSARGGVERAVRTELRVGRHRSRPLEQRAPPVRGRRVRCARTARRSSSAASCSSRSGRRLRPMPASSDPARSRGRSRSPGRGGRLRRSSADAAW